MRPRIFYGWYIVAAGMAMHMWMSIAWIYGMQVFFTPVASAFGWSRTLMSGAFSLQRLEGSIITPIEGLLVDKYGPRKMVLVGAVFAGLGLVSLSFLQNIGMFYGSVLLISLGTSASIGIPRNWAIVQWFRRLRGRVLGIGASGAAFSGPLLIVVVWLVEGVGWREAFLILGLITWALGIPLAFVYRGRPQQYGYLPDGDPPEDDGTEVAGGSGGLRRGRVAERDEGLTARQALRTPTFWVLTLVFGAQTMGVSGLIVHLIPYFESIDFSPTAAASVLAWFTMLSIIGRLGGGVAMDMWDRRLVLAGLLAFQTGAFLILANITAYWQVFPFALLYGIAFGGMIPARGAIISAYFGTRSFGAIQGLTQSATVLSGVAAPLLMGRVFDVTGSYIVSIYILMFVAVAAIPVTMLARPPRLPVAPQGPPAA